MNDEPIELIPIEPGDPRHSEYVPISALKKARAAANAHFHNSVIALWNDCSPIPADEHDDLHPDEQPGAPNKPLLIDSTQPIVAFTKDGIPIIAAPNPKP